MDCMVLRESHPMQSYRAEADTAACPPLFLTHYIRYYGIKPADNLRVTSYCDNESLSRPRRPHTGSGLKLVLEVRPRN
jgi:hypothetical protein